LSSTVIFPNEIFITPVLQLNKVLAIAKKGHPKITRIWFTTSCTGSVSITMKSTGK
jgi:hypothetical protein